MTKLDKCVHALAKIFSVEQLCDVYSQLVLFQKRLWLTFLFFSKERNSINCIGGIFQWLSYLDTFTETPTAPHQAVAANNLDHQGESAIPETPETEQQHILDDVVTSGSGNGKKSRKRRISECLAVYHFTVSRLWRFQIFFPRKSWCMPWSIWSPTTSLEKV